MDIRRVPISKVEVWDKNPRNIKTKDFERLKRQIQELGVYKPLICFKENGKYTTLGGNMRLRALKALSINEIDISIVDAKDEATKIKFALSDNDRAGEYNEQALAELAYPHIEEINLEDYKLDIGQPISLKDVIEDYAPDIDGEDEVPEIDDSPAITKMGDLFTLGKHRLLCGDATKEEDVKRLMDGEKADMAFTDPPYGIEVVGDNGNIGGNTRYAQAGKYEKVINDDEEYNPTHLFILAKDLVIFGANYFSDKLPKGQWLVWDKNRPAGTTFSDCELIWTTGRGKVVKKYKCTWDGFHREGESGKRFHPTQKPIKLFIDIFKDYSFELCIDPYIGSGTTLIACEKLNRICYGMEIEPKYCDVIITRYANFTDTPEEEIRATRQ